MRKYEVWIKFAYVGKTIEADSAEAAKQMFLDDLKDGIGPDNLEADEVEEDEVKGGAK